MRELFAVLMFFGAILSIPFILAADVRIDLASYTGAGAVLAHGLVEIVREHRLLIGFLAAILAVLFPWAIMRLPYPEEPATKANGNPPTATGEKSCGRHYDEGFIIGSWFF